MARKEVLRYEEYLYELMEKEREICRQNKIARMLRQSGLPLEKTLDSFSRKRLPPKVDAQVSVLLDGSFTERAENIPVFGNPGSGKTHLLCAIAPELIYRGKRVLFQACKYLIQSLLVAKRDYKLPGYIKKLSQYDIVFIDDIGYVQQSREEMEVFLPYWQTGKKKGH